jgi:hypothetical protein
VFPSLSQLSSAYRVPAVDYGRPSSGLLVSSGCGIMMATMDACPAFRWCVDADGLGADARLADWLLWARRLCRPVGFVGWFSLHDPRPVRDALAPLDPAPLVYAGHVRLGVGRELATWPEFIAAANS